MTILVSAAGGETHAPKIGRGGGREGYDLGSSGGDSGGWGGEGGEPVRRGLPM